MLVKDIMTKDVITVSPDTSLKEIGRIFKEKRISGTPVVDKTGNIVGIVTLTDLLRILEQIYKWKALEKRMNGLKLSEMRETEKAKATASDIMTRDVATVSEDSTIDDVMRIMFTRGGHTMPVTKNGKLTGVIGKRDLIDVCF